MSLLNCNLATLVDLKVLIEGEINNQSIDLMRHIFFIQRTEIYLNVLCLNFLQSKSISIISSFYFSIFNSKSHSDLCLYFIPAEAAFIILSTTTNHPYTAFNYTFLFLLFS